MTSPDSGWDRLLDRSVLSGYSSLGIRLRRRHWADDDPAPGALTGAVAMVTGAGGGLGEATVLGLAGLGARVHLVVRSPERAAPAVRRVRAALAAAGREADLVVECCDVADLDSVDRFVRDWVTRADRAGAALDVLVHNAGVMPPERTVSPQGHELSMATHVLGPVRMTDGLATPLARSERGARVVLVASGGMYTQKLPVEDPEFAHGSYRGAVAYARSKRVQVDLLPHLAAHWAPASVFAMHPGWVDTPGVADSLPGFKRLTGPVLRSPAEGADTTVWLAGTRQAPPSGTFWHDRAQRPTHYRSGTRSGPEEVDRTWSWVRHATTR